MLRKPFCLLIISIFLPAIVFAAPSIISVSGDDTIIITGSGFGTKSHAAPLFFDDFEDGTAGQLLPDNANGYWTALGSSDGGQYSNVIDDSLTGGTAYSGNLAAYNRFKVGATGTTEDLETSYHTFTATDKVYVSFYFRDEAVTNDDGRTVVKAGRVTSNYDTTNHYNGPGVVAFSPGGPLGSYWNTTFSYDNGSGATQVTDNQQTHSDPFKHIYDPETWHRFEVYEELSDAGVANGTIWFAANHYVTWDSGSEMTRDSGYSFQMYGVTLGLMVAGLVNGSDTDYRAWVDDVYVDDTRQRVELANASTWSSVTKSEVQLPTAWSDTSITITRRIPGYSGGETVYLYVFDADGNHNSTGYAIHLPVDYPKLGGDSQMKNIGSGASQIKFK